MNPASVRNKLIVAGDRNFTEYMRVKACIDHVWASGIYDEIVSGGARGVDKLGERWAKENQVKCVVFPADWSQYGKAAGAIRNRQMADYAGSLLAFLKPESRGTRNMITVATKLGLKVVVVDV